MEHYCLAIWEKRSIFGDFGGSASCIWATVVEIFDSTLIGQMQTCHNVTDRYEYDNFETAPLCGELMRLVGKKARRLQ